MWPNIFNNSKFPFFFLTLPSRLLHNNRNIIYSLGLFLDCTVYPVLWILSYVFAIFGLVKFSFVILG